jgi:hypothetical protein
MKEFKFLTKNKGIDEDMEIIDIGPIVYNSVPPGLVRGITYGDRYGNRKFSMIGEGHPLWDEIPVNR